MIPIFTIIIVIFLAIAVILGFSTGGTFVVGYTTFCLLILAILFFYLKRCIIVKEHTYDSIDQRDTKHCHKESCIHI